jgi:hypothetical protein
VFTNQQHQYRNSAMHNSLHKTSLACFAAFALAIPSLHAQILGTVGVYDENVVNTNTWNLDVPVDKRVSSSILGADFTTDVLNAFNNNMGGVANFDGPGESLTFTSGVSANNRMILGTGSALQLDFTLTDTSANLIPNGNQITNDTDRSRFPISGTHRLAIRNNMVFTFNGIYDAAGTTLLNGYGVSQFGITMLSRDNRAWTGNVVVTFSDNSTQTLSGFTVAQSVNTTDTFIGFEAPTGLFINQVAFTRTGGGEYTGGFDDFGVVVIPEPGTLALVGIALGSLLVFRRRNR